MSRYIDADALIEWIDEYVSVFKKSDVREIKGYVEHQPTIEPKRGEWIDDADKYDASFGMHDYRCSNCNSYADEYIGGHEWYTAGKPNFCPYCGADMREREIE